MNPQDNPEVHNPLHAMQTGEQTVCEIKRHPIGIIGVYIMLGFVLTALTVILFAVVPFVASSVDRGQLNYYSSLVLLVSAFVGVCYALMTHVIYWGNRWVVTSDSITQVQQTGLFTKQASQLSLENLEDVTAEQNGILAQMFHYGVIKAETAGERSKFTFLYCPNPTEYAQKILNARELFMMDVRQKEEARFQNQTPSAPTPPTPPVQTTP